MAENTRALARRILGLERQVRDISKPRLGFSSFEDGEAIEQYVDQLLVQRLGTQYDGTHGPVTFNGPTPPQPEQVLATPVAGGLKVYWDGTFADGAMAPMDFARVTLYAVTDPEDFNPLLSSQIIGHVTSAAGGEVFAALPRAEHFVYAVAWSTSGKFSMASEPSFATPEFVSPGDLAPVELPDVSPTPVVRGAFGAVVVTWPATPGLTVDVHVSMTSGFTATDDNRVASVTTDGIGLQWIRALPDGTEFAPEMELYVVLVTRNAAGVSAPQSDEAQARTAPVTGGDVELTADFFTATTALVEALAAVSVHVTGDLVAETLTALGKTAFRDPDNELGQGSWFWMRGGTTAPVTPTIVSQGWNSATLDIGSTDRTWRYGGTWHAGALYYPVSVAGGSNIQSVSPAGAVFVRAGHTQLGGGSFDARGVTRLGSSWYVLGKDYIQGGSWRVRVFSSDWVKTGEWHAYPSSIPYDPAIGNNGTNILLARAWGSGVVHVETHDPVSGAELSDVATPIDTTSHLSAIMSGTFDYGGTRTIISTRDRSGGDQVYVLNGSGSLRFQDDEWGLADSRVAALVWDGIRFRHLSRQQEKMWSYESDMSTAPRWVAGAWSQNGLETVIGPLGDYYIPIKRRRAQFTFPALPSGASGVSVYMAQGIVRPSRSGMWRQIANHPSPQYTMQSAPVFSGENPLAVPTYPGGAPSGFKSDDGVHYFDSRGILHARAVTSDSELRMTVAANFGATQNGLALIPHGKTTPPSGVQVTSSNSLRVVSWSPINTDSTNIGLFARTGGADWGLYNGTIDVVITAWWD